MKLPGTDETINKFPVSFPSNLPCVVLTDLINHWVKTHTFDVDPHAICTVANSATYSIHGEDT